MALSANTWLNARDTSTREGTILTGSKIYKHAMVVETAAGKWTPAANTPTTHFVGIAIEECPTGDGTVTCRVYSEGAFQFPLKTSVTVGMVDNVTMYAFDDQTITNLATLGPEVGRLVEFTSANLGWIELRRSKLLKAS